MTRSITGVLLATSATVAIGLLSGCGAGQQNQTSSQVPAITGVDFDVVVGPGGENGPNRIAMRNVAIAFKDPQGYPQGGTAPLRMNVINQTGSAVRLTSVTPTDDSGTVVLAGGAAGSTAPSAGVGAPGSAPSATVPAANPSASASAGTSPTGSPSAAQRPSATASASASASAAPVPSPSAAATLNLTIPADGYLALIPNTTGQYLAVTRLSRPLRMNDNIQLTFTFTLSDGRTATKTVAVPFTVPESPLPRSPMDLPTANEGGEGAGGSG